MKGTSKEYAAALYSLAKEKNMEENIVSALGSIKKVFDLTPELKDYLRSPGIPIQVRLETIRTAFEEEVPEEAVSFLSVLCRHGDIENLNDCIREYNSIYDYHKNVCPTLVTSAVELTEEEKAKLIQKLTEKAEKRIEVEYRIDPSLLGGLTVEMDGMIIDGSLKRRLQTMKEVIDE